MMKKVLQTLYLRTDLSSKSLTKRALVQLIAKIIYSLDNEEATAERISEEVSGILGASISNEKINSSLETLISDKKITTTNGYYMLLPEKRKIIDTAYNEFVNRQNRIIDKFFHSTNTERNFVIQWFENVMIEFFNEYSSEWISDLCVITKDAVKNKHLGIKAILDLVTDNNDKISKKDGQWLKSQFYKFLHNNDTDVYSILWDYGTSCFASSLITANTSADPISIEEFKDAKCILDTNVLMYLDLERSKFKEPFRAMENIFTKLSISPIYFGITREEFIRTMDHKRTDVIRAVENYSREVIEETQDPFLQTALFRGCETKEDFEIFFNQLMDIPNVLSDTLELKRYETIELENAIENGQKNEDLKARINNVYKRKRQKDKRKNPLHHDAGLIAGAEYIRNEEKCFILSRDISINEVALQSPIRNEMPIAVSIDTLINVLAIDNGGTDIDPTNYAPLFASIIKLALIPENDIFKVEDLARMLDVQTQISDLPSEEIIDIAKELHHNTIIGLPEDEISLQLTRRFQSAKLELQTDLDQSRKQTMFEKEEKEKYISQSNKATQKLRETYTTELHQKYDDEIFRNRILFFLIFPVVTFFVLGIIIYSSNNENESLLKSGVISLGINIIAWFIIDFFFIGKKLRKKYSERISGIADEVERRIHEDVK